ncbi:non-ribosomal peptide synthetase [Marinomonas posidonica]|uniref:Amino acid adenylation domain protein n=1 Tax=Marinomonas posidonica (strain CECT 7376 / NCIMB 14433 / IVIA-Po-181) TaxID=491952 RepID=F6CU76_MARPP|nr:non-ribosomal peptide synthetase [Marinomonas posidonica]AEF55195.1 amino acid adenylation domain protein [Marinomonas posidonica IVIA-Po-181]
MENNTAQPINYPSTLNTDSINLTDVQTGIWLADQISSQCNVFTIAHKVHINGSIDEGHLLKSIEMGLKEADTINAIYQEKAGIPTQTLNQCNFCITPEWLDLSNDDHGESAMNLLIKEDLEAELRLSSEKPLVRQILVKVSAQHYVWYQRFHHIMLDGFSFNMFTARVASIYQSLIEGKEIAESSYRSFYDVVREEQQYKASEKYRLDGAFWQSYCADLPHVMSLSNTASSQNEKADPSPQRLIRLNSRVRAEALQSCLNLSPFSKLTSADLALGLVSAYLIRVSGQWRVPVGFPFMGRVGSAALNSLGPVVNVVPMIVDGRLDDNVFDLALRIKQDLKKIRKHQKYNGEQIARDLSRVGEALYGPTLNLRLFDYDLSFGNANAKIEHLAAGPVEDLDFGMHFEKGDLCIEWVANDHKYDLETLQIHVDRFEQFAQHLLSSPSARLNMVSALVLSEETDIQGWQSGVVVSPEQVLDHSYSSLIECFYGNKHPGLAATTALVVQGREVQFGELHQNIAQWMQVLADYGVVKGSCVGLALPRDERMVFAMFAAMGLGAHYLPIDPTYPKERINWMLEDSAPQVLIASEGFGFKVPDITSVVSVDDDRFVQFLNQKDPLMAVFDLPSASDVAYIMYTSGSTGRAKGVVISHQGLLNLALAHWLRDGKDLADQLTRVNVMLTASFSFDTSWDILYWLCFGHTLHIVEEEVCKDPELIQQYCEQHKIHATDLPPSVLAQLFDIGATDSGKHFPELVYVGGEAASSKVWEQARNHPELKVRNYYGPTENTVDSLGASVNDCEKVIIGRPIANTQAYILDSSLSPVAIGIPGELYVSGPGLAHGYLNQPSLTSTRFIANPFMGGERMYRTGDLARWLENGLVEFIGRTDHQVQIRGHRVEPGEVEVALNSLDGVKSSIVLAKKQGSTHRLDAYVVVDKLFFSLIDFTDKSLEHELILSLSNLLPAYMVPATLTVLERFPLNTNGKVDRTVLPDPVSMGREGLAPKGEKEALLCQLVQQVLNLDRVYADDDFFALGGDSIVAMSLGSLARKNGYSLRAKDVFESRIISVMAMCLSPLDNRKRNPSIQSGHVSELPIYQWMKSAGGLDLAYFQAVCFALPDTMTPFQFEQVVAELVTAHGILSSQVNSSYLDVGIAGQHTVSIQTFVDDGPLPLLTDHAFEKLIEVQSKVKPNQTFPAMRVGYLQSGQQKAAIIALHHTIVDGVSWRIIFSELSLLLNNPNHKLQACSTTLLDWQATLQEQAARWQSQSQYWLTQLQGQSLFPRETSRERGHQRITLDETISTLLLETLPTQYQCQPQEALLSVLYLALAQQYQATDIPIMLESHGRAEVGELDLTRTLGWFTAEYPVRMTGKKTLLSKLNRFNTEDVPFEAVVQLVRRTLMNVPDEGVGYGVLRYLDNEWRDTFAQQEKASSPQILFNYLGRFQQNDLLLLRGDQYFKDTFEVHQSTRLAPTYTLEFNVFIKESQGVSKLAVHIGHDVKQVVPQEVEALLNRLADVSKEMARFAEKHQAIAADTMVTEDLKGLALTEQNLDSLRSQYGALQTILPALPLQEGLLFHAQFEQDSHADDAGYSSLARLSFSGKMNIARLKESLGAVIEKHPQLGALFDFSQGDTALQILPWRRRSERKNWWPLQVVDLSDQDTESQQTQLKTIEEGELSRDFMSFQSAGIPLLNAVLVTMSEHQHYVFLNAHHLVVDGWSTPIMLRDLVTAYGSEEIKLATTSVPYAWVVEQLMARDKQAMRVAWKDAMKDALPTLLYAETPPSGMVTTHTLTMEKAEFSELKAIFQSKGLTLNSVLQTLWANLLFTMTGRSDVVFGTPISGRFGGVTGIEEHIGLFSNTVPVRVQLQPELTLWQQMQQVQNEQIALLEYDGLGLAEIQRLGGHNNLFDTLLVVENFPEQASLFDKNYQGLSLNEVYNRGFTHYPLTVLALPSERLDLLFEYRGGEEIQALIARFEWLLKSLLKDSTEPQHALDLCLPSEKNVITGLNETSKILPQLTLRDALIRQALETPERACLSDENCQLTYLQARFEVVILAKKLQSLGVQSGDIVAVALPRSVKLSLALWAIIEVGAAYLPLDTGYPDDRLNYMLDDAKPSALITLESETSRFDCQAARYLYDGDITPADDSLAKRAIAEWQAPELGIHCAAYLLYTSGSTGRPKGVLVSHHAIVNRILWMQDQYPLLSDDVILQKTPCSFDVSVWEFFWSAMVGAKLHMAPPDSHRDPIQLQQLILDHNITTLHFVPSMLAAFVVSLRDINVDTCRSLKRVFCSGEALPVELSRQFEEVVSCELHNLYGPTEAAVDVTYYPAYGEHLDQVKGVGVPIGYPVWNTQLRILDDFLRPVPIGVAGELYLCGTQLADGYWRRPELCAARFVADPLGDGDRMYRTGDVVRWLDNGAVEYLGRSDDQLKIRGQRIELGEIEQVLSSQVGVDQSVVVAKAWGQDRDAMGADARQLIAYVTSRSGELDTSHMRTLMREELPIHMVPAFVIQLDSMPLSANGKLDRKALPLPSDVIDSSQGRPVKLGIETDIANAFSKVLGVTELTASDDFFSLGGHSILAVRLVSELRRALKLNVTVGQVMVSPSIEKLANVLGNQNLANSRELSGFGSVLPIKQGVGTPIFCIHPASGFAWQYTGFARYLSEYCPLIGLQSPRPDGPVAAQQDMDGVIDQHLNVLKERQPRGPYRLIGYSLGGVIAHGLAVRLQEMGDEVSFLGLLDTYPPDEQDWSGSTETEAQGEVEREKAQFMETSEETLDEQMEVERDAMFADIVKNYADSVTLLSKTKSPRYQGKAVLFVADKTVPDGMDIQATWTPYLDSLEEHHFDFAHEDILSPEALVVLGPLFNQLISG